MMKTKYALILLVIVLVSCQREEITFSARTDETFYVDHMDSKMRVQVRGNTLADKIVLTVHGGPGGSSYYLSDVEYMQNTVEPSYAVAYWDQPLAGSTQGNRVGFKLDDIADGLKKVIHTLRHRYGQDKKIILFSESWGGIVSTTFFLSAQENQGLVDGWINADGPHDFKLMDREMVKMAITIGEEQIASGKNVNRWNKIVSYCKANNPPSGYDVSTKLNDLLGDAEYLIDDVVYVEFSTLDVFRREMGNNNAPFTALGLNLFSNNINEVEKDAYSKDFAGRASEISVPMLLLWGKYDFIAPPAVGDSLFQNASSTKKKLVILERSGHNGFLQEPEIFWKEFMEFMDSL